MDARIRDCERGKHIHLEHVPGQSASKTKTANAKTCGVHGFVLRRVGCGKADVEYARGEAVCVVVVEGSRRKRKS